MISYEECLCDPDKHDTSVEIIEGKSVIVTYTCQECSNKVYDTNYTIDDIK